MVCSPVEQHGLRLALPNPETAFGWASDPDSGGRIRHLGVVEHRFKIFPAAKAEAVAWPFDERWMNRSFGLRSAGPR
jgi:hypothetical protein